MCALQLDLWISADAADKTVTISADVLQSCLTRRASGGVHVTACSSLWTRPTPETLCSFIFLDAHKNVSQLGPFCENSEGTNDISAFLCVWSMNEDKKDLWLV